MKSAQGRVLELGGISYDCKDSTCFISKADDYRWWSTADPGSEHWKLFFTVLHCINCGAEHDIFLHQLKGSFV